MDLAVRNCQTKIPLNLPKIKQTIRKILKAVNVSDVDLSVVFVSENKIKSLNQKYLRHDYATDIITFDLSEGEPSSRKVRLEAEIFIAPAQALKNAKRFETDVRRELDLYLIHGILHLLGYDDHKPADIKRMRAAEQRILKIL